MRLTRKAEIVYGSSVKSSLACVGLAKYPVVTPLSSSTPICTFQTTNYKPLRDPYRFMLTMAKANAKAEPR